MLNRSLGRAGIVAGFAFSGVLASCDGSDRRGGTAATTVTDSARIEIVSSPAPLWESGRAWRISDTPTLEIGTAVGEEAYTLYGVRAAIRLDDGRIAVANQRTAQIRIYDRDGRHLEDLGRRGDGPGEFQSLMDLWRGPGDSIVAADNRLARLTVLDDEGGVGRTIPLQQSPTPRQLFGRRTLGDGTLLVSGAVPPSEPPREGLFDGGIRQFDRYDPDGRHLNHIGELPHGLNWGFNLGGGESGFAFTTAPFSIFSPPHASDGESVFLGDGTLPEVRRWSPEGELLRIIRWGAEPREVTSAIRDGYRSMRLDGATTPEFRQSTEAMLDGLVFPDYLPVYETLLADSEGLLWVKPYTPQWERAGDWWVFDSSGRWLGNVPIPPGLTLLDVGSDYILGSVRDEQDVERVLMYNLDRRADA